MKILYITWQHAMYFVKYKTHSAPNFPEHIHIVNDNVYKKYIYYILQKTFLLMPAQKQRS